MEQKRKMIRVAVGIIWDQSRERILVSRRQSHQEFSGLWEFPGGKLEAEEAPQNALKRELQEELSIEIIDSEYLFSLHHQYPDKNVELIIYNIYSFNGEARGAEGQIIEWRAKESVLSEEFPAANGPIIHYLKTGEKP